MSRASEPADLDRAVADVAERAAQWSDVSIPDRIQLLRRCIDGCVAIAGDMAVAGCRAKDIDPTGPAGAEEWFSGPLPMIRNQRLLIESLAEIQRFGKPVIKVAAAGQDNSAARGCAVTVFPRDSFDRVLYPGTSIDVWLDTPEPAFVPRAEPRVVLVLGAGNVSSIGPMDLLYKLFVENKVVVLKMHPLSDYLGPFFERAFAPLVEVGSVRIVYGGVEQGQHLVAHPQVDEIHITGSVAVHDAIARSTTKPITSELGCVTPVIVVPGEWSDAELAYQAENVATMVALNASCNCNAAKLIVTWTSWPQRRTFLTRVRDILEALPPRRAYYPGSARKYERFVSARGFPDAPIAAGTDARLRFVCVFDVDPARHDDVVFTEEAWSPVVAETALAADDAAAFLDAAVEFCNEHVAGTLSMVLLIGPRARRQLGTRFTRAVAALRYGTVAINHWSAMNYALANAPWGAYAPSARSAGAAQFSGVGFVHNTSMLDGVIKSVLDGPFTTSPKPPWFCTHRRAHIVARQSVKFEAAPSWWKVPGLAAAAYRA